VYQYPNVFKVKVDHAVLYAIEAQIEHLAIALQCHTDAEHPTFLHGTKTGFYA
jgi:hypothetical protein